MLSVGYNNVTSTFGGTIQNSAGALTLQKIGGGTLCLTGANTYGGGTVVSGGVLSIAKDDNLGAIPDSVTAASITLNGGTLQFTTGSYAYNSPTINYNRGITLGFRRNHQRECGCNRHPWQPQRD